MTRRGNSEGSIYQRADGRWVASVDLGWQDGRRQRKLFYASTRRAAASLLTENLKKLQDSVPIPGDRQTVGTFFTRWLVDSVKSSVRPSTWAGYESKLRVHILPELGRLPLVKLSPQHLVH